MSILALALTLQLLMLNPYNLSQLRHIIESPLVLRFSIHAPSLREATINGVPGVSLILCLALAELAVMLARVARAKIRRGGSIAPGKAATVFAQMIGYLSIQGAIFVVLIRSVVFPG